MRTPNRFQRRKANSRNFDRIRPKGQAHWEKKGLITVKKVKRTLTRRTGLNVKHTGRKMVKKIQAVHEKLYLWDSVSAAAFVSSSRFIILVSIFN